VSAIIGIFHDPHARNAVASRFLNMDDATAKEAQHVE
jgi:alpha-D-ribose 1-methylphosphonate 5-triphosphate synthase subunit PhnL